MKTSLDKIEFHWKKFNKKYLDLSKRGNPYLSFTLFFFSFSHLGWLTVFLKTLFQSSEGITA